MKKASLLKKVTIAALVLMLIAMLLEIILIRALNLLTYEALAFFPVRLLTLIATNMLGGCIFTKILKIAFLSKMDDSSLALYKKFSLPIFWVSAFLILIDCAKDAYLNPDTTTVSLLLVSAYLFLTSICSFISAKNSEANEKLGFSAAAFIVFAVAAAALVFSVYNVYVDLATFLK